MTIKQWKDQNFRRQSILVTKNHTVISNQLFKRLKNVAKDINEVELTKFNLENCEPIIVVFFVLKYAKLRILNLHNKFLSNILLH